MRAAYGHVPERMSLRKNYFSDRIRVMNYNRFFMISDTVSVVSGLLSV